ncbi:MAG: dissimilatory-type sulfite reductase subunit alpha [Candidatus Sumerlaeia bacterium]|nr:dissimilatory-type sulfite reductase subunit alpha [Candidatus Sumerlaeia bacterium]
MAEGKKYVTPKLDELEKGPWPSFVKEIKAAAQKSPMAAALLGQLEQSYDEKIGHWKHGGIVGVVGYGGGVIGRYSDLGDKYPEVAHFHTIRINQPAGWFYTTEALRGLCDIWEEHGSGLTNMHGSTGDIIFLGTTTDQLEKVFSKLTALGFDLGGSGSDVRTPSCCNGMARCEWACYDTMKVCYNLTMAFQDEIHRPAFPYKFKMKMAGCPNDCVAAIARADLSIIGTWKDEIQQDDEMIKKFADEGLDIQRQIVSRCPTRCMDWDGKKLTINNENCVKCMFCINSMPRALAPGKERGAMVLLGAKAPIVQGAQLSSVLIPFIDLEDEESWNDLKQLLENIWEVWCEEGKNRERVGEFALRVGFGNFLEAIGLEPRPEMVAYPRDNPYVFYQTAKKE